MNTKTLAVLTAGIIAANISAAENLYPKDFKVFFSNEITTEHAASLRFEDDVLFLNEKNKVAAQKATVADNIIDLRKLDPEKKFQHAALSATIYADKPGKLRNIPLPYLPIPIHKHLGLQRSPCRASYSANRWDLSRSYRKKDNTQHPIDWSSPYRFDR